MALFVTTVAIVSIWLTPIWVTERSTQPSVSNQVMLILRGNANSENPNGQLDDAAAVEYARRVGFRGEVLDVAADAGPDGSQVKMALERIRRDHAVSAIYGFSGGGYNARSIWKELTAPERERIRMVVVVGSPGVSDSDFGTGPQVIVQLDPPAGHLAGPKVLLESLSSGRDVTKIR